MRTGCRASTTLELLKWPCQPTVYVIHMICPHKVVPISRNTGKMRSRASCERARAACTNTANTHTETGIDNNVATIVATGSARSRGNTLAKDETGMESKVQMIAKASIKLRRGLSRV